MAAKEPELFKTKIVQAKNGSGNLFEEVFEKNEGPVTCLGMTFKNDDARRAYFTDKLRDKLKDPEFKKIEGFPIGEDEDILALSDPPYYTACPNPWIQDFIEEWEAQKPEKDKDFEYHREPFAADVSEGKNDPIYNTHSYHTKVPHKAIMRYILHYTEPGDIVFDGFCGSGMTGVAAQMCEDKTVIESLGVTNQSPDQKYKVTDEGLILERQLNENGKADWIPFSKLGARKTILNDLSPAATFITSNHNKQADFNIFKKEAKNILENTKKQLGWMYLTLHEPSLNQIEKAEALLKKEGKNISKYKEEFTWGSIRYIVWSESIRCNVCGDERSYWELAVDKKTRYKKKVNEPIKCPQCNSEAPFKDWDKVLHTIYDPKQQKAVSQPKQTMVLISYSLGSKIYEKFPDSFDLELLNYIQKKENTTWYPCEKMLFKGKKWGDTWRSGVHSGLNNVHHFYFDRSLHLFSFLFQIAGNYPAPIKHAILFWIQSVSLGFTKLNRYLEASYSQVNRYLKGTLYVARFTTEVSASYALKGKISKIVNLMKFGGDSLISTESSSNTLSMAESVDYIFVDPPFGGNIMYSELNFIWESWLKVFTNSKKEAIENASQTKSLLEYQDLMVACFKQFYIILKPNRWITVEFHNSKNSVWNCIQEAMQKAGFIIADVRTLDKKQMTMQQMTSRGSVKQDLVISAYKPNEELNEKLKLSSGLKENAWEFIRNHLKQLPSFISNVGKAELIAERQGFLLFDRMVAFHVQRGVTIPFSAAEFYSGLEQRFPERDGMYFLSEQAAEYDRKKLLGGNQPIQQALFVSDETSAINWLRKLLRDKPKSFQELNPQFMKIISGWSKSEKPLELSMLLEQNFLCYDGKGPVPSQIHAYLSSYYKELRNLEKDDLPLIIKAKDRWYVPDPNKATDIEKLREKTLLKEFEQYKQAHTKLKIFRMEAVRAGFKKAYQEKNYQIIIDVAQKIPSSILEEDPKLLMWYDHATTRLGEKK